MIVSGLFSIFSTKRNDLHNEIEDYDVEEGSFNFYMKKLISWRYSLRNMKMAWVLHFPLLQPIVNVSYLMELNMISSSINNNFKEHNEFSDKDKSNQSDVQDKTNELTELAMKNKNLKAKKISIISDFLSVMIYEAFLEAAPQATLQIMIVLKTGIMDYSQLSTIVTSLLSLTAAAVKLFWEFPTKVNIIVPFQYYNERN